MLLAFLTSCKKTTNVDMSLSTSGKLTYRLLDDSGKGIPNLRISLFDNIDKNLNSKVLIDSKITNQDGQVDFGDLNPSNYLVAPDSVSLNNVKYNVQDYVQVITGAAKNREVKVSDFSGTYNFKAINYNKNQGQPNVGILMIPTPSYIYLADMSQYVKLADYKGVTDAKGLLSFKVPSNKEYTIYVYNTTTNAAYMVSSFNVIERNQIFNQNYIIYEN